MPEEQKTHMQKRQSNAWWASMWRKVMHEFITWIDLRANRSAPGISFSSYVLKY
jgi:hypothetical protein